MKFRFGKRILNEEETRALVRFKSSLPIVTTHGISSHLIANLIQHHQHLQWYINHENQLVFGMNDSDGEWEAFGPTKTAHCFGTEASIAAQMLVESGSLKVFDFVKDCEKYKNHEYYRHGFNVPCFEDLNRIFKDLSEFNQWIAGKHDPFRRVTVETDYGIRHIEGIGSIYLIANYGYKGYDNQNALLPVLGYQVEDIRFYIRPVISEEDWFTELYELVAFIKRHHRTEHVYIKTYTNKRQAEKQARKLNYRRWSNPIIDVSRI